jgi:hypothetical protein
MPQRPMFVAPAMMPLMMPVIFNPMNFKAEPPAPANRPMMELWIDQY